MLAPSRTQVGDKNKPRKEKIKKKKQKTKTGAVLPHVSHRMARMVRLFRKRYRGTVERPRFTRQHAELHVDAAEGVQST
jgi:hypothetical protein